MTACPHCKPGHSGPTTIECTLPYGHDGDHTDGNDTWETEHGRCIRSPLMSGAPARNETRRWYCERSQPLGHAGPCGAFTRNSRRNSWYVTWDAWTPPPPPPPDPNRRLDGEDFASYLSRLIHAARENAAKR